jgi:glutamate carboxypeptidase
MTDNQIQKLMSLVEINSWTWNKSGVDMVGELVMEMLSDVELEWTVTPSSEKGNLLFARSQQWDDSKPSVLLSGHIDTVFKENWPTKISGDKFYGPGTMDMKAGVLAIIELLIELQQEEKLSNIMVLLTPDEEDGFHHLHRQFGYYKQADYAFVFEEGSHVQAGKIRSLERALVLSRKALSFFEFWFKGPGGGHQAKFTSKDERHSAILEMSRFILDLEKLAEYDEGTLINTGLVQAGISPNSIADEAYMKVDVRYGSRDEVVRVKKGIEKIMHTTDSAINITKEESLYYPSFEITKGGEILAEELISSFSDLNIHKEYRSAGSEANWISDANKNCIVIDGFGVVGEGDHSKNEYFLMSSFQDSISLAKEAIKRVMGG